MICAGVYMMCMWFVPSLYVVCVCLYVVYVSCMWYSLDRDVYNVCDLRLLCAWCACDVYVVFGYLMCVVCVWLVPDVCV